MIGDQAIRSRRPGASAWGLAVLLALGGSTHGVASAADDAAELAVTAALAAIDVHSASASLAAAVDGEAQAFEASRARCDAVAGTLPALKSSMARLGNSPEAGEARRRLAKAEGVAGGWLRTCAAIVAAGDALIALHRDAAEVDARLPALQAQVDLAARRIAEVDRVSEQLYLAARQALLLERMRAGMRRILDGGADGLSAADRLARDLAVFDQVLDGLVEGSRDLSVAALDDAQALAQLRQVRAQFDDVEAALSRIGSGVARIAEVRAALDRESQQQAELVAALRELSRQLLSAR